MTVTTRVIPTRYQGKFFFQDANGRWVRYDPATKKILGTSTPAENRSLNERQYKAFHTGRQSLPRGDKERKSSDQILLQAEYDSSTGVLTPSAWDFANGPRDPFTHALHKIGEQRKKRATSRPNILSRLIMHLFGEDSHSGLRRLYDKYTAASYMSNYQKFIGIKRAILGKRYPVDQPPNPYPNGRPPEEPETKQDVLKERAAEVIPGEVRSTGAQGTLVKIEKDVKEGNLFLEQAKKLDDQSARMAMISADFAAERQDEEERRNQQLLQALTTKKIKTAGKKDDTSFLGKVFEGILLGFGEAFAGGLAAMGLGAILEAVGVLAAGIPLLIAAAVGAGVMFHYMPERAPYKDLKDAIARDGEHGREAMRNHWRYITNDPNATPAQKSWAQNALDQSAPPEKETWISPGFWSGKDQKAPHPDFNAPANPEGYSPNTTTLPGGSTVAPEGGAVPDNSPSDIDLRNVLGHPDTKDLDPKITGLIDRVRKDTGLKLPVTSGYRGPGHHVAGVPDGEHASRLATDIHTKDLNTEQITAAVMAALKEGASGIGLEDYKTPNEHLHIDLAHKGGKVTTWGADWVQKLVKEWNATHSLTPVARNTGSPLQTASATTSGKPSITVIKSQRAGSKPKPEQKAAPQLALQRNTDRTIAMDNTRAQAVA